MQQYDIIIRQVRIMDGNGHDLKAALFDVVITGDRIAAIVTPDPITWLGGEEIASEGHALVPGFIDARAHDDTNMIRMPDMLYEMSQGITTVIVGNCDISTSPATLEGDPPNLMNLLGPASTFAYPAFASYTKAAERA